MKINKKFEEWSELIINGRPSRDTQQFKIILRYTSLANAAKAIEREESDSAKLLGLGQVLEKWIIEAYQQLQSAKNVKYNKQLLTFLNALQTLTTQKYNLVIQRGMRNSTRNSSKKKRMFDYTQQSSMISKETLDSKSFSETKREVRVEIPNRAKRNQWQYVN